MHFSVVSVSAVVVLCLLSINALTASVRAQNWPATSTLFSGNYQTSSAPVLTVFSNNLYLAFANSNGIFFANTSNVASWPVNPTQIPGQQTNSGSSPAIIGFQGKLVVAFRSSGTTGILTGVSYDGVNFPSISMLPSSFATARGPRFTKFNDVLYLYYQGADNRVYFATSFDGLTWGNPTALPDQFTSQAPALIAFNGKLVMAFRSSGTNQILTGVSNDGFNFGSFITLPSFYQTLNGLVLATYGCNLYLAYEDPSGSMYLSTSKDGVTWSNLLTRVLPNDATSLAPALQEFQGQQVLMFRSSGSNGLLAAYTSA